MPTAIHGEGILGKRCSITFQISPKLQQTSQGCVAKYEGSLENITAPNARRIILYRQCVAFDNGDEKWFDLEVEEAEGRLQWLPDLIPVAAEDGAQETDEEPSNNKKQKKDEDHTLVGHALTDSLVCIKWDMLKDVFQPLCHFWILVIASRWRWRIPTCAMLWKFTQRGCWLKSSRITLWTIHFLIAFETRPESERPAAATKSTCQIDICSKSQRKPGSIRWFHRPWSMRDVARTP